MPPKVEAYSQAQCPWCHRAMGLLKKKDVEFEEILVSGDTPEWEAMIERTGGRTTPQILIGGEIIGGYTELAALNAWGVLDEKLGRESDRAEETLYDVMIIGLGPAGMTAAIYASRKGLQTLVLSKDVGGQLNITAELENYPGYSYIEAQDLIDRFEEHVDRFDITRVIGETVTNIEIDDKIKAVRTEAGNRYRGRTLIVASGKSPRPLGVPGEDRLMGKGVAYCATCDAPFYKNKVVAVVGAGNSALEAAGELDRMARKVHLIVRGELIADDILIDRVHRMKDVEILQGFAPVEILGEDGVTGVRVRSKADGTERTLEVDGVFVEVGLLPNSAFAIDALDVNETGEIVIDCQTETGAPGVFAAGDVTNVKDKQVVVAAGEGAKAALRANEYILAKR
ncbi:MAG: FAD-dependent oxidoreductase [Nitrospinota bacterium]|jgi:alkyl hydroperoxide reductase subunit F|nr:FAD-dependent oxidoreductase [Nitrospinota bacterium]